MKIGLLCTQKQETSSITISIFQTRFLFLLNKQLKIDGMLKLLRDRGLPTLLVGWQSFFIQKHSQQGTWEWTSQHYLYT